MRTYAFLASLAVFVPSLAQALPSTITNLQVNGNVLWNNSGFDIDIGEILTLEASGTVSICVPLCAMPPDGSAPGIPRPQNLAPDLIAYSLIGRVGTSGTPFFVGSSFSSVVSESGRIFLTVNDELGAFGDNSGAWIVNGSIAAVPEPTTSVLLGFGLLGLCTYARRSRTRPCAGNAIGFSETTIGRTS